MSLGIIAFILDCAVSLAATTTGTFLVVGLGITKILSDLAYWE